MNNDDDTDDPEYTADVQAFLAEFYHGGSGGNVERASSDMRLLLNIIPPPLPHITPCWYQLPCRLINSGNGIVIVAVPPLFDKNGGVTATTMMIRTIQTPRATPTRLVTMSTTTARHPVRTSPWPYVAYWNAVSNEIAACGAISVTGTAVVVKEPNTTTDENYPATVTNDPDTPTHPLKKWHPRRWPKSFVAKTDICESIEDNENYQASGCDSDGEKGTLIGGSGGTDATTAVYDELMVEPTEDVVIVENFSATKTTITSSMTHDRWSDDADDAPDVADDDEADEVVEAMLVLEE